MDRLLDTFDEWAREPRATRTTSASRSASSRRARRSRRGSDRSRERRDPDDRLGDRLSPGLQLARRPRRRREGTRAPRRRGRRRAGDLCSGCPCCAAASRASSTAPRTTRESWSITSPATSLARPFILDRPASEPTPCAAGGTNEPTRAGGYPLHFGPSGEVCRWIAIRIAACSTGDCDLAAAILFPLIVLVGFGRTYYFKGLFGTTRPLPSSLVHLHGLVMTAWVVLFVVQVRLASSKRIHRHQQLGYAGIGLGALIIATGLPTALRAAKYGSASAPPAIPPLSFLLVPTFDLLIFALLFGAAILYRRRPAAHKRLMLLTAVNFLPPALARVTDSRHYKRSGRSGSLAFRQRSRCYASGWTRAGTVM